MSWDSVRRTRLFWEEKKELKCHEWFIYYAREHLIIYFYIQFELNLPKGWCFFIFLLFSILSCYINLFFILMWYTHTQICKRNQIINKYKLDPYEISSTFELSKRTKALKLFFHLCVFLHFKRISLVQTGELKEKDVKGLKCDVWFGCLGCLGLGLLGLI